ncbi:MAG TPA: hypothetical protein VGH29_15545 [Candidatus Binataceae bacterium]
MNRRIRAALVVGLAVGASMTLARLANAGDPSLNLEGTGDLSSQSCACSTTSCAGVFTANLTGTPFATASLNLPLSTGLLPVAGKGGCATATGFGTLNSGKFSVQFYGQVCSDPLRQWFSLSGNLQLVVHPETPGLGTAASGTLVAGGPIHLPCGAVTRSPFPGATAGMLVSILGVTGKVPLLTP